MHERNGNYDNPIPNNKTNAYFLNGDGGSTTEHYYDLPNKNRSGVLMIIYDYGLNGDGHGDGWLEYNFNI